MYEPFESRRALVPVRLLGRVGGFFGFGHGVEFDDGHETKVMDVVMAGGKCMREQPALVAAVVHVAATLLLT